MLPNECREAPQAYAWGNRLAMRAFKCHCPKLSARRDAELVFLCFLAIYFSISALSNVKIYKSEDFEEFGASWWTWYLSAFESWPCKGCTSRHVSFEERFNWCEVYPRSQTKYLCVSLCFTIPKPTPQSVILAQHLHLTFVQKAPNSLTHPTHCFCHTCEFTHFPGKTVLQPQSWGFAPSERRFHMPTLHMLRFRGEAKA